MIFYEKKITIPVCGENRLMEFLNGGKLVSRGKGGRPDPHIAHTRTLIFVSSGTLVIQENKIRYKLKTGDWLFLDSGSLRRCPDPYPLTLNYYWLHFNSAVEKIPRKTGHAGKPELVSAYCELLLAEAANRADRADCSMLFLLLCKALLRGGNTEPSVKFPYPVEACRNLIATHFPEKLNTSELAHRLGYHPDYLGELFRHCCGITITDALNEKRIQHASELLARGMSIKEAAFASGFNALGYFRRQFVRSHGILPSLYRKQVLSGYRNTE